MNQPEFTDSQIQTFFDEETTCKNVLKDFNGRNQKPLLSKTKMTVDVTYPILRAQRKNTKIGDSIALELGRREQALLVGAYEHPPGANEDGYLGLKLRNKFGRLLQISNADSFAWTSGRQLVSDGTLSRRVIKKITSLF